MQKQATHTHMQSQICAHAQNITYIRIKMSLPEGWGQKIIEVFLKEMKTTSGTATDGA